MDYLLSPVREIHFTFHLKVSMVARWEIVSPRTANKSEIMKKLEKLTPEQEAFIPVLRKKYEDMFYNNQGINKEVCEDGIEFIYSTYLNRPKPVIMYMDSPLGVQLLVSVLKHGGFKKKNLSADLRTNIRANLRANLSANLSANIRDNLRTNLWANLRANLWANLGDNLGANLGDNLRANYERPSYWANIGDYGWVAFYDFIQQTNYSNDYDFKSFDQYKKLLESGIYELVVMDGLCVVCSMPKVKQDSNKRLHCETGPAATWRDGFSMWYYHGMAVPRHWIENRGSITAEEIKKESNAEKRRALRDLMGTEKYYDALGGVNELDRDTDDQGNEMILYESKEEDSVVNKKIQYLEVLCPSTMRKYVLYPTKQCSNVWDAKASTFNGEKIKYRHGDVGLLDLKKEFNHPICES